MIPVKAINLIKDKNIRLTHAREELLGIFVSSTKPLSYEDVKDEISMDRATFYRNISKFEQEGILNSFESNDKKRYFEIQKKPHAHFICKICNAILCLYEPIEPNLEGYEVDNIIIQGTCKSCVSSLKKTS
jgi:Fur family ferric uptake transcriptional regulator